MEREKEKTFFSRMVHSLNFNIVAGIVAVLLILGTTVAAIGYKEFTKVLEAQYDDTLYKDAVTATSFLNPAAMERLSESENENYSYKAITQYFQKYCDLQEFLYMSVTELNPPEYSKEVFLIDVMGAGYNNATPYEFKHTYNLPDGPYKDAYRMLYEGGAERQVVIRDGPDVKHPHITMMVPVKDTNGVTRWVLSSQKPITGLRETRLAYVRFVFSATAFLILVTILLYSYSLRNGVVAPLQKITREAARFAKEGTPAEKKLGEAIKTNNEIGTLADSIDWMEEEIERYIEHMTMIAADQERLSAELNMAANIQKRALPTTTFPDHPEFMVRASMDPALHVGGDFYDFLLVDDDHLALVIADVSGKGMPAAMLMMSVKIRLATRLKMGGTPAEVLARVNNDICEQDVDSMFVTVWIGILELSTGILTAANAGHEYPIVCGQDGEFRLFKDKHGFVLGGMEDMKYKDYTLKLEKGDRVFVYTDGVTEATRADGALFGTDRLIESLNAVDDRSPQGILEKVKEGIAEFVGDAPQFDDTTMMCLYYIGEDHEL